MDTVGRGHPADHGERGGVVTRQDTSSRPLFIFEMANNHMGSVEHGLRIVKAMHDAAKDFPFSFAVKLQYRDIDTFIHPDYQVRPHLKFVKRFSHTRLSWES